MSEVKPKIFVFINDDTPNFFISYAISEDGIILANHCSSSESWAKLDMGMFPEHCKWKHEKYQAYYPNGYDLEFVSYGDVDGHEGLQKAFRKYEALKADNNVVEGK